MRNLFIVCLGIICVNLSAQNDTGENFSLEQAIDYATANSNTIKQAQLDVSDADAQILEYWTSGIPTLTANGRYVHNVQLPAQLIPAQAFNPMAPPGTYEELTFGLKNQFTASLDFQMLIFSGSFFVGLQAQQMFKDLMQKNIEVEEVNIKENVTKAYYNVLISKENLDIVRQNLKVAQESYDDISLSYEAGFAEKLDVDRLELSVENLRSEVEKVESSVKLAKNLLKFQMNYPVDQPINLAENMDEITPEIETSTVAKRPEPEIENRPEYKPLLLQSDLNEVNIKSIRAGYLPRITGVGNYQQQLSRDNLFDGDNGNAPGWIESAYVGVNLSVPIFDGLSRNAQIQRAQISRNKVQTQISQFEKTFNLQVENARISFKNAVKTQQSAERSMELADNIYETTTVKFNEGVGSSVELRQAEQELYNAQAQYINATYELMISYVDMLKAEGKL